MEQFVIDQVKYGLKCLPVNLVKSFLISDRSAETERFKTKAGGFICGVCHPTEKYQQLKDANIRWIRIDIPMPYNAEGEPSDSYASFKSRCEGYKREGIKVMAVTPYPHQFISMGFNPVEQEDKVREVARFLVNDLREYIDAIQVTNEMGMPIFTLPLNLKQAARFIGIQLEEIYPIRGKILIGYNSAGPQADLHSLLKPYHQFCDYVGIDIYIGCFYNVGGYMWFYDALLRYLWAMTKKPILLQEFGYIGLGETKSNEEKQAILNKYGAKDIEYAYEHIEEFVSNLPKSIQEYVIRMSPDVKHQADFLFKSDFVNHLFCELPKHTKIPGYPHTPQGQADFFKDIIPRLHSMPYVCGAFIYCYSDDDKCYICKQADCPTETKWGLVDVDGNEKPAYYAVKEAFGKIQGR